MADEAKESLKVRSGGDEAEAAASSEAPKEEQKGSSLGSLLSAPGTYGNAAGDAIQGTLGKVGNPLGKGLETVGAPVGGIVEPLVGGLFKSPENFAKAADASKEVETHNEDLAKPIAGQEQTAKNPLGLNEGGSGGGS